MDPDNETTNGGATPETTTTTEKPAATPPAGAAPAATPPAPPANAAPPAAPAPKGGDEEMVTIPKRELNSRIERAKKGALKEVFGEDVDPETAKQKATKAKELEAQAEEQRRQQLTKEQQLEEDLRKEREQRTALETKLRERTRKEVAQRETQRISSIATKHIDPSMAEFALPKFRAHLKTLKRAEINAMTDKDIEKFFAELVKKNPRFARQSTAPARNVERRPVTNGSQPNKPVPHGSGQGAASPKTARPGQPNSMTKAEIREKFGVGW